MSDCSWSDAIVASSRASSAGVTGIEDSEVVWDSWLIERSGCGEGSGDSGTAVKLVDDMLWAMGGADMTGGLVGRAPPGGVTW